MRSMHGVAVMMLYLYVKQLSQGYQKRHAQNVAIIKSCQGRQVAANDLFSYHSSSQSTEAASASVSFVCSGKFPFAYESLLKIA